MYGQPIRMHVVFQHGFNGDDQSDRRIGFIKDIASYGQFTQKGFVFDIKNVNVKVFFVKEPIRHGYFHTIVLHMKINIVQCGVRQRSFCVGINRRFTLHVKVMRVTIN